MLQFHDIRLIPDKFTVFIRVRLSNKFESICFFIDNSEDAYRIKEIISEGVDTQLLKGLIPNCIFDIINEGTIIYHQIIKAGDQSIKLVENISSSITYYKKSTDNLHLGHYIQIRTKDRVLVLGNNKYEYIIDLNIILIELIVDYITAEEGIIKPININKNYIIGINSKHNNLILTLQYKNITDLSTNNVEGNDIKKLINKLVHTHEELSLAL